MLWLFLVIAPTAMALFFGGVAFEQAYPIKRWTWWHTIGLVIIGSLYAVAMLGLFQSN